MRIPYPAEIYICYVAPLVTLGTNLVVRAQSAAPLGLYTCTCVRAFFAVYSQYNDRAKNSTGRSD